MRTASVKFTNTSYEINGNLTVGIYTDAAKTAVPPSSVFSTANEVYLFFSGEGFRIAVPHVPVDMEIEFFDMNGVSVGALYDLQTGDTGLEWNVPFYSLRIKTSVGLSTSLLEIWGFASGPGGVS